MKFLTIHAAKKSFSKLIERLRIIIVRGSIPVLRLIPFEHPAAKRQFGALRGKLFVPDSFFEPLPANELTE